MFDRLLFGSEFTELHGPRLELPASPQTPHPVPPCKLAHSPPAPIRLPMHQCATSLGWNHNQTTVRKKSLSDSTRGWPPPLMALIRDSRSGVVSVFCPDISLVWRSSCSSYGCLRSLSSHSRPTRWKWWFSRDSFVCLNIDFIWTVFFIFPSVFQLNINNFRGSQTQHYTKTTKRC